MGSSRLLPEAAVGGISQRCSGAQLGHQPLCGVPPAPSWWQQACPEPAPTGSLSWRPWTGELLRWNKPTFFLFKVSVSLSLGPMFSESAGQLTCAEAEKLSLGP